jgi:hypothetical protein
MQLDFVKDAVVGSVVHSAGSKDIEVADPLVERLVKAKVAVPSDVRKAVERAVIRAPQERAVAEPGVRRAVKV